MVICNRYALRKQHWKSKIVLFLFVQFSGVLP